MEEDPNKGGFEIGDKAYLAIDCFYKPVVLVNYEKAGSPGNEVITGFKVETHSRHIKSARICDLSKEPLEGRILISV